MLICGPACEPVTRIYLWSISGLRPTVRVEGSINESEVRTRHKRGQVEGGQGYRGAYSSQR
jgi:hypothetical protein